MRAFSVLDSVFNFFFPFYHGTNASEFILFIVADVLPLFAGCFRII